MAKPGGKTGCPGQKNVGGFLLSIFCFADITDCSLTLQVLSRLGIQEITFFADVTDCRLKLHALSRLGIQERIFLQMSLTVGGNYMCFLD